MSQLLQQQVPDARIIIIIKSSYKVKKNNFTSKSWVTPWRSRRHKDQHLQQDQQHDAHFPEFILFRFDVAPLTHTHTYRQSAAAASQRVCVRQCPKVCSTNSPWTSPTLLHVLRSTIKLQRKWLRGEVGTLWNENKNDGGFVKLKKAACRHISCFFPHF